MKINYLTATEENLMKLFWSLNSFYLKDVMEHHPEPKPHQNTISTYLKILVEKGYLTTEKEGRIFKYSVAVPMEDYRNFLLKEGINMSAIKDRLQEDWKTALKAKDKFTASVISTAKAALLIVEKTDNRTLEDDEVITILAKISLLWF